VTTVDEVRSRAPGAASLLPLLAAGAAFLAMFDATVVNLVVPALARSYPAVPVPDLTWIITLYAVTFAALLAPAGRLADVVGRRALFLAGSGIFTAASLACAVSVNVPMLLVARGVQGAGAAAMVPASLSILLGCLSPERRPAAVGMWGAASAIAAAIGPSGGGALIFALGWRSVFYVNVPLGLALMATALAAVQPGSTAASRWPDLPGTVMLGAGVGGIVFGLAQGQDWGWTSARTATVLAAGAVVLAAALYRSARSPVPAVEISLWRTRRFAIANLTSLLYGIMLFPWLLVGVLFLTQVWGYSVLQAGLAQSPGAVTAAITALGSSRLIARYGPQAAVVGGTLILVVAVVWISLGLTVQPHPFSFWIPTGLLVGVGTGALAVGTASAGALSVAPDRFAGAVGLNTAGRQVGGALGVAALVAILPAHARPVLGDFRHVYEFCGAVAFLTIAAGGALARARPPADSPS
jgi:EmrB/QacA subfamily drug resistance transporter